MPSKLEVLESRLRAGDNLNMTLQRRDELQSRIARARSLREGIAADDVEAVRRSVARSSEGTTATLAALGYEGHKVAPEFRSGLEQLGGHIEAAAQALDDGYQKRARKHLRAAQKQHAALTTALQD